jgi:hypothetical protein
MSLQVVMPPASISAAAAQGAVAHEGVGHVFFLGRPDVRVEPGHQRHIVGETPKKRHRGVTVQVDEAGDQRASWQGQGLGGDVACLCGCGREHIQNIPALDDHGMVGQGSSGSTGTTHCGRRTRSAGVFMVACILTVWLRFGKGGRGGRPC